MESLFLTLWAGVLLGVSFIATPIKFKAKSLTKPVALDVGKTTFHFLIKIERILLGIGIVILFFDITGILLACLFIYFVMLNIQTFVLLPKLDRRIELIISGEHVEQSKSHKIYAVMEIVKVLTLIISATILAVS